MDRTERAKLIEMYATGYQEVINALDGITERDLDIREAPGEWSSRQIVHHLADSEMTAAIRIRRLLAENRPVIVGYDQDEFARALYYDRPIEPSLAAFKSAREATSPILERMTETEWVREGTHSETGQFNVSDWLRSYGVHAHDHADQIRRARSAAT